MWTEIAPDHWVATIDGKPVSIKKWPDYWVLARAWHTEPALTFHSLEDAQYYVGQETDSANG